MRSKATGYCVEIAQRGKVPEISLRKGVVNAVGVLYSIEILFCFDQVERRYYHLHI